METARCKAFVAAARKGSFTGAAEELNYTTSAVSQLITALEEDLRVTLFQRTRKGVVLTADGERLFPVIDQMIRQERRIYETAAEISGLIVGSITIAAYPSICAAWLPGIIRRFQEKYPGVTIRKEMFEDNFLMDDISTFWTIYRIMSSPFRGKLFPLIAAEIIGFP